MSREFLRRIRAILRRFKRAFLAGFVGAAAAHLAEHHGIESGHLATGVGEVAFAASATTASVECRIDVSMLEPDDVADVAVEAGMPLPVHTMRLGLPKEYLIAEFDSPETVRTLIPDMGALEDRFGFLAYARSGATATSRFFAPGTGVPEDPATGSAAVALAHSYRLRGDDRGHLTVYQGDEIGHPSTILLDWIGTRTTIGGTVRPEPSRNV